MLKLGLIQPDITDNVQKNLDNVASLCAQAAEEGADVLILPELFSTGFPPDRAAILAQEWGSKTQQFLAETAIQYGATVIAGCGDPDEKSKILNNARVYAPGGDCKAVYHKIHLFSYGREDKYVIPGETPVLFKIKAYSASVFICYDLRFPGIFRAVAPEVSIIFVIANWPQKRRDHWCCLLKARAIENQCWVIGVNRIGTDSTGLHYCGDSMVVDPMGKVIKHMPENKSVQVVSIDPDKTVFVRKNYPFLQKI